MYLSNVYSYNYDQFAVSPTEVVRQTEWTTCDAEVAAKWVADQLDPKVKDQYDGTTPTIQYASLLPYQYCEHQMEVPTVINRN